MHTHLLIPLALLGLVVGCTRTGTSADAAAPARVPTPAPVAVQMPASTAPATPALAPALPAPTPTPTPASGTVQLALSGEGLDFVSDQGSVRHLLFDVPATQAIDAVSRMYATAPERGRNEECGAGPLDMAMWPSGLTVVMQHDRFVGWSASARRDGKRTSALSTMAGVGPGSMRRELEAAYAARTQETTLGQEFSAAGLLGVLDGKAPTARINAMWAGTSCNFR